VYGTPAKLLAAKLMLNGREKKLFAYLGVKILYF